MPDLSFFGSRERALRQRAHGRVLDLGERRRAPLEDLAAAGEKFDSIVSIFQLSASAHPLRDARAVERLLTPDGRFFFLEPTASPGIVGTLQRMIGRPNHDIPGMLREAGLSMSLCDRITVSAALPARMYIEGVALRALSPVDGAPIGSGGAAPVEI
jgi:hypothetical protein